MKAIWYEKTGPAADVLRFGRQDAPVPAAGEVRVRLAASGVNPSDTKRRAGWIGLSMPHPRIIPHSDGAGTIDAVGEGVDEVRLGERVWLWNAQSGGRPFGTAAEYAAVPAAQAVPLPDGASFADGAGLGVPGCTAHYAVYGDGPVGGKRILVQGGAGAVGHLAVQLATLGAAEVIATVSSAAKAEVALSGGARHAIDYRREDVADRVLDVTDGEGVDRIIEVDLAANLETDVAVLGENGTIASYSSTSGPELSLAYYPLAFKDLRIHFVQGYLLPPAARRAAVRDLTTWLAAGQLETRVAATFPLAETASAHEALESGRADGKILVEVQQS
ncbi:NADPH:quinone reductase [Candidatus Palauibacter sp.]|uniref:NADPH:quinone reductase n=1 Tax=Candidatus Palauibacter sp. TaxID=3101350 RepID=UPI003B520423